MIVDAHCHAWKRWPYPDTTMDCSVEALLRTLDAHVVDHALVVAARIGHVEEAAAENHHNNEYVADGVHRHPDRLFLAVEVDGHWSAEYGSGGAAARLDRLADALPVSAVALYPAPLDDGWLGPGPGADVVARAAELGLLVSVAATPGLRGYVRALAARHPDTPFLLHHLGLPGTGGPSHHGARLTAEAYADLDNVYLKVSGLYYAAGADERHPFEPVRAKVLEPLARAFGPKRLLWGSDFPAYRSRSDYGQALEALTGLGFALPERHVVAGATMAGLLGL